MIRTRADLKYYLAEDRKANDIDYSLKGWFQWFFNPRLRCIRYLRHLEYFTNGGGINIS